MTSPDHQLARSTAEEFYPIDQYIGPKFNLKRDELTALILVSYHERDRAATGRGMADPREENNPHAISGNAYHEAAPAMGGETEKLASELMVWSVLPLGAAIKQYELHRVLHKSAEKLRTLERGLSGAYTAWKKCEKSEDKLQREISALRDELARLDPGVHSCSDSCQRPVCVLRRELAALQEVTDQRHAATMLHTQSVVDENMALRSQLAALQESNAKLMEEIEDLQESNREAVAECHKNGISKAEQADLPRLFRWQRESLSAFRAKFNAGSNLDALDAIDTLRARLALADEMAKALHDLLEDAEKNRFSVQNNLAADDCLRRWTAPQAGKTSTVLPEGRMGGLLAEMTEHYNQQEDAEAVSSRAIPITPETVVPFPCWLFYPYSEETLVQCGWWREVYKYPTSYLLECGITHYHEDQAEAPTCRPTATEGGKV